ncbi:MAG TPA: DUF2281 domain-containing protein [Dyadobacter sp.]|jgi:hypothetical protein|nr:DUF2281 domain-containing protein [Dyadobacter sp.]
MSGQLLYSKIEKLPKHMKMEVADFVDILISRSEQEQPEHKPRFGSGKGMFKMSSDFDAPLEDFKEYM